MLDNRERNKGGRGEGGKVQVMKVKGQVYAYFHSHMSHSPSAYLSLSLSLSQPIEPAKGHRSIILPQNEKLDKLTGDTKGKIPSLYPLFG